ncbi:MAG: NAD-dependent aldehyde dehydrogenase [Parcubacteria group bacterium GW2011_GWD2_38_11]|nr:MAG: NAD-dependent aldehyde dehydrogenase [Parcubacteria group bacterium GW2011_GWD2_38_11]
MNNNNYNEFIRATIELANKIDKKRDELISILCMYESRETAVYEIQHSIKTLQGFSNEFSNLDFLKKYGNISIFFPINLPLYSLVLFAITSSAFAKKVRVRPPMIINELLEKIVKIVEFSDLMPNIFLYPISRKQFLDECVEYSQVVIFNGRYENVQELITEFPDKKFIFNGRGINPAIVGNNANIDLAVKKIVEMRIFNSGQDCAGIDVIFVSDVIYEKFVATLKEDVSMVSVGNYNDEGVRIGKVQRIEYINELKEFLLKAENDITFRGVVNYDSCIVTPHIIERDIKDHNGEFVEFFAPIFYILKYESESELLAILNSEHYSEYAMYASVFGTSDELNKNIPNTQVLINKIVNDIEIGNEPYGGYGAKANFVYHDNNFKFGPVLISNVLAS